MEPDPTPCADQQRPSAFDTAQSIPRVCMLAVGFGRPVGTVMMKRFTPQKKRFQHESRLWKRRDARAAASLFSLLQPRLGPFPPGKNRKVITTCSHRCPSPHEMACSFVQSHLRQDAIPHSIAAGEPARRSEWGGGGARPSSCQELFGFAVCS